MLLTWRKRDRNINNVSAASASAAARGVSSENHVAHLWRGNGV